MKVNVTIDCTPEEARTFFGLPDLKPMQERMMAEVEQRMRNGLASMEPEAVFKTWLPATVQGMEQVQQMFWSQMSNIAGGQKK